MNPYRIACLGALICTVVAWIVWGPWGGIAVAAPCVILLLIALPHALGAADDVGSTEVTLGRLTIGVSRWDGTVLHDPDPEWPDWIDAEGEPMPRHDAGHAADAWAYLRTRPDQHTATLRQQAINAILSGDAPPEAWQTLRMAYNATSPEEDATCRNLSAGSPVSSA